MIRLQNETTGEIYAIYAGSYAEAVEFLRNRTEFVTEPLRLLADVETVVSSKLAKGDVVWCHGSRFILTERYSTDPTGFHTEYLGPITNGEAEGIPEHWRKTWAVQGNDLAKWAREVAPATAEGR